ncbi:hypothetical protein CNYM01_13940 [Colletotrichum nymphaeae SA-01]|uniref:Geranylgeranyl pyrophosphate synthetase n=1 Tax=Colletotrichum nymphaeae SA-01 TaxID=1460502 RepID=A0A135SY58_9PEZI|nr:hypothetical protein CNYM01_13940 [Colletotrichum nymphaeae SA-01]
MHGFAAVLQKVSLPITVPEDQATRSMNDSTARIPEYSLEPLFRATASMNPSFRFDEVDILVIRNSLRKLLNFCRGRRQDNFRLNLYLVHRTLIIERCEKTVTKLTGGSQNSGWGRNFERTLTRYPPGLEDSTAHHRALRYQLRDLTCAVRFEVDACYQREVEEGGTSQSLARAMSRLQTDDSQGRNASASQQPTQRVPMAQADAAEIKTAARRKSSGAYMPQLWFGRTPWLILGQHTNGTFEKLDITDTAAQFASWEETHQLDLRKLAAVLAQLREAVRENGGKFCIAIHEKAIATSNTKVYPSCVAKEAVPEKLKGELWS